MEATHLRVKIPAGHGFLPYLGVSLGPIQGLVPLTAGPIRNGEQILLVDSAAIDALYAQWSAIGHPYPASMYHYYYL
jgi:hypothetical protein